MWCIARGNDEHYLAVGADMWFVSQTATYTHRIIWTQVIGVGMQRLGVLHQTVHK